MRRRDARFLLPDGSDPVYLPPLTTSETAALAADAAAASERDALVKVEGRVRHLETRLAAVELSLGSRFRRALTRRDA